MRTFPQHPCDDVSPLPRAAYFSPLSPCFLLFRRPPFDSLSLPLSPFFLSFFLSFRSKVVKVPRTPFRRRPNNLDDRRRVATSTPPRLSQLCRIAEWETVRDIFLPGTVARYFPAVVYLLLPSPSFLLSFPFSFLSFVSSRFIALRRRCVSREILGRREYETTTGRHCTGDRRTDNRNDSPAHLYLNDSHRVFLRRGEGDW